MFPKEMKKILIALGIIALLGLGLILLVSLNQKEEENKISRGPIREEVNYKASFAIFTNGTFRIFTDSKYHNQSEEVYMEEANIVIVKKSGVTWNDFFKTLPMKITKECLTTGTGQVFCTNETQTLKFYINGKMDKDALDREIKKEDKLLISYGSELDQQVDGQLKQIPDQN